MKKQLIVICLLLQFSMADAQDIGRERASISIDLAALMKENAVIIGFSHRLSDHWSAEGSISPGLPGRKMSDPERQEHEEMLTGETIAENDSGKPEVLGLGFRFWKDGYMTGSFISISCMYGIGAESDIRIGAGYAIRLLKGTSMSIGYETGLLRHGNNDEITGEGLNIRFTFIF